MPKGLSLLFLWNNHPTHEAQGLVRMGHFGQSFERWQQQYPIVNPILPKVDQPNPPPHANLATVFLPNWTNYSISISVRHLFFRSEHTKWDWATHDSTDYIHRDAIFCSCVPVMVLTSEQLFIQPWLLQSYSI